MRLAFLLLFLSAAQLPVESECVELSQRKSFLDATVVFRGTVVKIEDVTEQEANPADKVQVRRSSPSEPRMVTFMADQFWKGPATRLVRVFLFLHPQEGSGYKFKSGGEYIVYTLGKANGWGPLDRLSEGERVYNVGPCILRIRSDVAAESKLLGKGRTPR
jgi:hypothetical protein